MLRVFTKPMMKHMKTHWKVVVVVVWSVDEKRGHVLLRIWNHLMNAKGNYLKLSCFLHISYLSVSWFVRWNHLSLRMIRNSCIWTVTLNGPLLPGLSSTWSSKRFSLLVPNTRTIVQMYRRCVYLYVWRIMTNNLPSHVGSKKHYVTVSGAV